MENRMNVHLDGNPIYDILMETGFVHLKEEMMRLDVTDKKLCIVTDSIVAEHYLEEVSQLLADCCQTVIQFVFPAGEENKQLGTVQKLYETLIVNKFDRNDILVALGGGVVGDLCGYGAATYLRGVSFVQIPTTLLSQVDSSIGGKTGVDFHAYKNMIGAFHMPRLVYTNVETLLTLTEEQFTSGLGEIIKHGLIKDKSYYRWLSDHREEILSRDLQVCCRMIWMSDEIKKKVVEEDPMELGDRALLNFGHTLGHAIEKLMEFRLLHGHCVGLGCLAASYLSARRGSLSMEEVEALRRMMVEFHMPVSVSGLNPVEVVEATKHDKKMDSGIIRFILLKAVGEAYIDRQVTEEEMAEGLSYILDGTER